MTTKIKNKLNLTQKYTDNSHRFFCPLSVVLLSQSINPRNKKWREISIKKKIKRKKVRKLKKKKKFMDAFVFLFNVVAGWWPATTGNQHYPRNMADSNWLILIIPVVWQIHPSRSIMSFGRWAVIDGRTCLLYQLERGRSVNDGRDNSTDSKHVAHAHWLIVGFFRQR